MTPRKLITAAIAAQWTIMGCAALAQEPRPAPNGDAVFYVANGAAPIMPLGGKIDVLWAGGSVIGEVVENKPYSAESLTESTQLLADGNRITTTNRSRVYRDSAGRTRREQQLDAVGVWKSTDTVSMITIDDPVKHMSYFVDPRTETVRVLMPMRMQTKLRAAAGEPDAAGGVAEARIEPAPVPAGTNVVVHGYRGGDRTVTIASDADSARFEIGVPPAAVAFGAAASIKGVTGEVSTENLGDQVLEGVLARGTRVTNTIPAGAIGNERSIEIVHEEWYSPDIEAVVLRRDFDPRFGETIYRLISIDRSEPPAELFEIPQDYEMLTEAMPPKAAAALPVPPGVRGPSIGRRVFVVQPAPAASEDRDD
jgi:hypothetical protein